MSNEKAEIEKLKNAKYKSIKCKTPRGIRNLSYKPVSIKDTEDDDEKSLVCHHCTYLGKCDKFKHPETPEDENSTFQEFCSDLGLDVDRGTFDVSIMNYVPVEGTLEENLSDLPDAYQALIAKGGYVKLNRVIDIVCKDSCPFWNEEHTECKTSNNLCILEDLIKPEEHE